MKIMQCFQSKTLRITADITWHVNNKYIHQYLKSPKYQEEIIKISISPTFIIHETKHLS
ncbi:hypothetical protein C0J52_14740 [Blattella germanica]|nr:hypothetical protein C0J52_14740 [Blattella germanica]